MKTVRTSPINFDDGDWPTVVMPSELCGSLREHEAHEWMGQTTGIRLHCPGANGKSYTRPKRKHHELGTASERVPGERSDSAAGDDEST